MKTVTVSCTITIPNTASAVDAVKKVLVNKKRNYIYVVKELKTNKVSAVDFMVKPKQAT